MKPPNAGEDVGDLVHSSTAGGNIKATLENSVCCQFLIKLTIELPCNYHMIQQLHSWAFILEEWKLMFSQKPVNRCTQQLYLQYPQTGNDPRALQWVNC